MKTQTLNQARGQASNTTMEPHRKQLFDIFQLLRGLGERESLLNEIGFAYDIALHAHKGQKRDDGQDYISHPVAGCMMMAKEFGIKNAELYIAFMLHDVGEDTAIFGDRTKLPSWTFETLCLERVKRIFGPRVAELVIALTKPAIDRSAPDGHGEMMKRYLERLSKDYPAIALKMIDRLHNLRSLCPGNPRKIERQVNETKYKLMPIFEGGIQAAKNASDIHIAKAMTAIKGAIEVRLCEHEANIA